MYSLYSARSVKPISDLGWQQSHGRSSHAGLPRVVRYLLLGAIAAFVGVLGLSVLAALL